MPPIMDAEAFRKETNVSRETLARLECFAALLTKWNKAINLVSRNSLPDLWHRHMLDSAQLQAFMPPVPKNRPRIIVDFGSGAGFPGLVLAILGAGHVHLVEADQKKATFLREVARETDAQVTIINERVERLTPFAVDVVTARAFAPLPALLDYAAPFFDPSRGFAPVGLFLKGAAVDLELTEAEKKWTMEIERYPSQTDSKATILRLNVLQVGESKS